jgi:fused signal recognition particle receptor
VSTLVLILIILAALLVVGGAAFVLRGRRTVELPQPTRTPEVKAPPAEDAADTAEAMLDDVDVDEASELVEDDLVEDIVEDEVIEEEELVEKATFRDRLSKAREGLAGALGGLRGRKVDEEAWEELEEALILADVGVPTTMRMLERVRERCKEDKITDFDGALTLLREEMETELGDSDISLAIDGEPAVWMFVGVNGVGKTTTIGKLAKRETDGGRDVVLAAGDTFRAAAAEQLETWANRCDAGFIRGSEGADPGSVIFDAVEHAAARNADLVLADTAGRLHNKANLMEELSKVRRVAEKGAGKVSEVLLVIDATTGQNGMNQAKQFTESVDVTGIVLTKLDGSAKGGIVLAIQSELGIPVKLVGLGEGIEDLVEFDAGEFVDALFA